MTLTIIMMIVSFLLTKSSTGDTKKGLVAAGLVGAGTALVTSQTEWGSDVNASFNESIGLDNSWSGFSGSASGTGTSDGQTTSKGGTTKEGTTGTISKGIGGFFESLPTWLSGGAAAGAAAFGLSAIPSWVWWVGGGLLAYNFLFKKD